MLCTGKRRFLHPVKWGGIFFVLICTKSYHIFQPVLDDQGKNRVWVFFFKRQWAVLVKAFPENVFYLKKKNASKKSPHHIWSLSQPSELRWIKVQLHCREIRLRKMSQTGCLTSARLEDPLINWRRCLLSLGLLSSGETETFNSYHQGGPKVQRELYRK